MKPSLVKETLIHLIKMKQPTMVWGPPGVGKSDVIKQVAEELKLQFIDLRLPLLDSVDLRGIPSANNGKTKWLIPSFLPTKGKGILFLDEIMQALPIVQSAASQLILDRKIGDYTLPSGWVVIAAGNRETDRAATNKMPSHIANRFVHINFEIDVDDWVTWAISNKVDPSIIAYIGMQPAELHVFDPTKKAFPTPRSWSFVSKIVSNNLPRECLFETIAGTIGDAVATSYTGFLRVYHEMLDYSQIVSSPTGVTVPDNSAVLYATVIMVAFNITSKDSNKVFKFIKRLPKEFQILTMQNIAKYNLDMCETRSYIKWQADNQDVMFGNKKSRSERSVW